MTKHGWCAAMLMGACLLGMGCQGGTQKKEAYKHWNATRASIQASMATERYKLGNLEDARKAVDEAIKLDPENASYHVLSARVFIERNQLDLADKELEVARKLDPKNAEADYLAGVVYQRWQKPNLALEYYTAASEKSPTELSYLMAKAEMLVQLNRMDDAVTLIESRLTFFEYSGPLRDMLGGLYLQQNKLPQAIESLHQASILSPDDTTIREHLARVLFRGGKYRDALDQFDALLKFPAFQQQADLYMLKGECHAQLQQWREARAALETSLEKNAGSAGALLSLAKVSMKMDDLDRAEDCVRKAIALNPDSAQAYLRRGSSRCSGSVGSRPWPTSRKRGAIWTRKTRPPSA